MLGDLKISKGDTLEFEVMGISDSNRRESQRSLGYFLIRAINKKFTSLETSGKIIYRKDFNLQGPGCLKILGSSIISAQ